MLRHDVRLTDARPLLPGEQAFFVPVILRTNLA